MKNKIGETELGVNAMMPERERGSVKKDRIEIY